MTSHRRVGSRAPGMGFAAALMALLLLPTLTLGADWSVPKRVSNGNGSRFDSLHQLDAAKDKLHLVYPRIGPGKTDDRVVYLRSSNDGATWTSDRILFSATNRRAHVVPNLAIAARGDMVVVAWRTKGSVESSLFVRVSRDGGKTFAKRLELFATRKDHGIGVPAVAIGDKVVAVAWTNRASGEIKVRTSRDGGQVFRSPTTLGRTRLSIDCDKKLTDGLVGLAANDGSIHVAWSHAPQRQCYASSIRVRTSLDRGQDWSALRTITERDSFGWAELDSRGKTVVATVQATNGGLITARSAKNGRNWQDRLLQAPSGHSFSAADITLLPGNKAWITYVNERLKKGRLVSTKLVARRSTNDGATYQPPRGVTKEAKLLRMAPNVVANDGRVTIVVQSGQLDGSPRHLYATRLR